MAPQGYLMESDDETRRLDLKTDPAVVTEQGLWAGLGPGMRIADLGCGSGKTTYHLNRLTQPGGSAVGLDISPQRISFAGENYADPNIDFICRDLREPLDDLGLFDFIWVRFVLEYYRTQSFDLVQKAATMLKPGGTLCLIDLDHNCLNNYGLPPRLEQSIREIMTCLEERFEFDPYVGRKLYAYLYDLGFEALDVHMAPHHLIFGDLGEADLFNWTQKVEVAGRSCGYAFESYRRGFDGFHDEFKSALEDKRRFIYTPVICCRGSRPNGAQKGC